MSTYIGLLHKEAGSDYGVSFPDLPGCVTAGKTLEEARKFAAEALAFHLRGLIEDGEDVPAPSDLDTVMADPESQNAVAVLVEIPDPKPTVVRVNVTFEKPVLEEIDEYCERTDTPRSAFLASAGLRAIRGGTSEPQRRASSIRRKGKATPGRKRKAKKRRASGRDHRSRNYGKD